MTSKPTKSAKTPAKKKPVTKKAPVKKIAKNTTVSLSADSKNIDGAPKSFTSSENLNKSIASTNTLVKANDIKSLSLRKKMLAWFKISR